MNKSIFLANLMTPGLNGRWGCPRLYWGPPGVAKTGKIQQLVHSLGMECKVILASIRDPADFNGIPVPKQMMIGDKDITVMDMAPPRWAVEAAQAENCVVFLDEISTASPSVQAALLRVVLDGAVGDLQLPPGVRFIAAANPTEMAAGGFDLSTPLANRFGHEEVNLDASGKGVITHPEMESWCDWLISDGVGSSEPSDKVDPKQLQAAVLQKWGEEYARARGEIVGFMYSSAGGPNALFDMPDLNDPKASRSWPSFRSWECAARALAGSRVHNLSDVDTDTWMISHVGTGPVAQFRQHISQADLPDPRAFLESGGKGWKHDAQKLDRTLAVFTQCASLVCSLEDGEEKKTFAETLWEVMTPVIEVSADICLPTARALIKSDLSYGKTAAVPMGRLRPMLVEVGIMR